jgi:hypothetical protein
MTRRPLCTLLVTLLTTSAAFAADIHLTIYHADDAALFSGAQGNVDAGNALVHETRALDIAAGEHTRRIGGLPATLDPEAIAVGLGTASGVHVLGQRIVLANDSATGALQGAMGRHVIVDFDVTPVAIGGASLAGTLVGVSDNGLLIRTGDGSIRLVHKYDSVTLPADAAASGSTLLLDVDAGSTGTHEVQLTYTTSGLGWRAAYAATLANGGICRMRFDPEASIANRSGRDYRGATIKLVAGQPNLGNSGVRMYGGAATPAPMMAVAHALPQQATLGDYRSYTLPGAVDLPDGTVTLTPLYAPRDVACQREYVIEDGGTVYPPHPMLNDYGPQDYRDRPIASTLAFTAPEALPAGSLRAWIVDHDGVPELLGIGDVADTPKGQHVSVQLGQSFDLRASRTRTAFHVDARAHTLDEAYRITLTDGGDAARTVTLRERPDRWREWTLVSSSLKPARQTPQLLEFHVPVPAHGSATLEYAIRYTWTQADM